MQSLGIQPAAAKTAAMTEQTGTAERPSFRTTMERAEQDAAQKAAAKEPAKPNAKEEPQAVEDQQPEDVQMEEGLNEANNEAPESDALQEAVPEANQEAMEGLLGALTGQISEEEEPEEDALAEGALQIGELGAAMVQQETGAQQPEIQPEVALEGPTAVQEGQAVPVTQQVVQEGQPIDSTAAAAQTAIQSAANREGEQTPGAEQAQAAATNLENTISETVQPAATKAGEQNQSRENNAQDTPIAQFEEIFAPAQQTAPVVDLAPAGAPLPEAEMAQTLQEGIFEQIQTAVNTGKDELFIQLKPETLGGLVIQLTMTEEGLKAQVRTGSENIQSLVNAQIAQLEDTLRAKDIPVVEMEVIYEQFTGNNPQGQQRQAWQEQGGGSPRSLFMQIEDTAGIYEAALANAPDEMGEGLGEGVIYSA